MLQNAVLDPLRAVRGPTKGWKDRCWARRGEAGRRGLGWPNVEAATDEPGYMPSEAEDATGQLPVEVQ